MRLQWPQDEVPDDKVTPNPPLGRCLLPIWKLAGGDDSSLGVNRWVVYLSLVIVSFGLLVMYHWRQNVLLRQHEQQARENLVALLCGFEQYAQNNRFGAYPPLSRQDDVWAPELQRLFPQYLSNPDLLVDPTRKDASRLRFLLREALQSSPPDFEAAERIAAQSYIYTGFVLRHAEDARFLTRTRKELGTLSDRVKVGEVMAIREGVERFLVASTGQIRSWHVAEAKAAVPVLFSTIPAEMEAHELVHVLYLDGHVAQLHLGSTFPATESVLKEFGTPPLSSGSGDRL